MNTKTGAPADEGLSPCTLSVHVLQIRLKMIPIFVNEYIPLRVSVTLQWVISCAHFLMICIAAVLLRIYCIDV